jgi:hypothetical protein
MNVGPFVASAGFRAFRGAKEQLNFDLWRKNGSLEVFVLVRRFRISSDRSLEWAGQPPSESVPIGFMVPIEYWDDRVDEGGTLLWTA